MTTVGTLLAISADAHDERQCLSVYRRPAGSLGKRLTEMIEDADEPEIVANAVLKAVIAAHPKLRYTAGGRASCLRLLRRFAPAGIVDAGIRKMLKLDAVATIAK